MRETNTHATSNGNLTQHKEVVLKGVNYFFLILWLPCSQGFISKNLQLQQDTHLGDHKGQESCLAVMNKIRAFTKKRSQHDLRGGVG